MTEHFGLILDILVVCLLGATIFYAATLSRRLTQLRNHRAELETAARGLAEAAARADAGIKGLRAAADDSGTRLQRQIDRAQGLRDELAFLVDAGESLAARLESAARGRGPVTRPEGLSRADGGRDRPDFGAGRAAAEPRPGTGAAEPRPGTGAAEPRPGTGAGAGTGADERRPDADLIKAIENMR